MTTELEQEFFKVFGIEPKHQDACTVEDKYWQNEELANKYGTFDMYMNAKCGNQENCTTQCSCAYTKEIYPEITDRKLLEMICILQKFKNILFDNLYFEKIEDLKKEVLSQVYKCKLTLHEFNAERLKHQIQQLFKGEE